MDPKVYSCIHNSPPLFSIPSQTNPVHTPSPNRFFLDTLILPFNLCLGLASDIFSHQILHAHLLSPICAPSPTHLIFLDFITWAILVRSKNQEAPQCAISSGPLLPPPILGPNVFFSYSFLKHSQNGSPICVYFGIA